MADNKLLNKVITISGKEEKLQGGKPVIKLKDEKGLTYTVYKTKQDGSTSVAWEQIQELNLGDTVQIGYVEDIGEYQGKAVTYRTVRNFNKDIGEGAARYQSSPQAEKPSQGQNIASQGSRNYEREAYEKCCSIWSAADLQRGATTEEIIKEDLNQNKYWELFQAIKKDGEKKFAKGWARAEAIYGEELPTIQVESDEAGEFNPMVNDEPSVKVEDIPF